MRYFFHISYNGFDYHGWQRQSGHITVQEVVEDAFSRVLTSPCTVIGCGRTDAQVHAAQYFFHLDIAGNQKLLGDTDELVRRVNKVLPGDIAVFEMIPVAETAHAQYDAKKRTYDYFIHTRKDPFLGRVSALYEEDPDTEKMNGAVQLLTKYKDYRSFCKSPDQYKHTLCNISSARLFADPRKGRIRFQVTSDRFLHGMIRALMAKLIRIGIGKLSADEFEDTLIEKKAASNLEFAWPQGLHLSKVEYLYLERPVRNGLLHNLQVEEPSL